MTVSSVASEISYAGDGSTTVFAIPFEFDTSSDLKVILTDANGNAVVQSSGFTITGGAGLTGSITMATAPGATDTLTILDDPERKQSTDYINNDSFPAETHEAALDKLTRIDKRLYQILLTAIRASDGDPSVGSGLVLPSVANRKGKYARFADASGNIEAAALADSGLISLSQSIIAGYLFPQTAAETAASVTPSELDEILPAINIARLGADTGSADNSTAINNAILVAEQNGGVVVIPPGTFTCTSDINLKSNVKIMGCGWTSKIEMSGAKIHADGPTEGTFLTGFQINDLQISRVGSAGPAVHLEGGESSDDPIRWLFQNVYISGSTGDGLLIESGYIGDFVSPLIRGCAGDGVQFSNATTVAANAISFYGGEIQNNNVGVRLNDTNGIRFFGTTIEGNTNGGVDMERRCAATCFYDCWFEGNGVFDIRVGNDATNPRQSQGLTIIGGLFSDGSSGKDHGIILLSCNRVHISNIYHTGYGVSLVANDQVSAGAVRGIVGKLMSADSQPDLDTPNIYIYQRQYDGELAYSLRTGPGAIDLTSPVALITTTGADALTLADGYESQRLRLSMISDGGDGTLTPTNLAGGTTITFDDVGDTADLQFLSGNWHLFGGTATLA